MHQLVTELREARDEAIATTNSNSTSTSHNRYVGGAHSGVRGSVTFSPHLGSSSICTSSKQALSGLAQLVNGRHDSGRNKSRDAPPPPLLAVVRGTDVGSGVFNANLRHLTASLTDSCDSKDRERYRKGDGEGGSTKGYEHSGHDSFSSKINHFDDEFQVHKHNGEGELHNRIHSHSYDQENMTSYSHNRREGGGEEELPLRFQLPEHPSSSTSTTTTSSVPLTIRTSDSNEFRVENQFRARDKGKGYSYPSFSFNSTDDNADHGDGGECARERAGRAPPTEDIFRLTSPSKPKSSEKDDSTDIWSEQ